MPASVVFDYFKKAMMVGSFNLQGSPTIYCELVGSGYTPDNTLHLYRASLTNEITGTYTAGGFALSSPGVKYDTGLHQGILTASNIVMYNVTFGTIPYGVVLYGSSGAGIASDPLIAYIDLVTYNAVTNGTFQITWAAGGVLATT